VCGNTPRHNVQLPLYGNGYTLALEHLQLELRYFAKRRDDLDEVVHVINGRSSSSSSYLFALDLAKINS
jgi:hypothetical protein